MFMHTYRDLIVWQKAIDLSVAVYQLSNSFPREELYGLTSQIKRSTVSIPANIAEGRLRNSNKEFKRFLHIAFGSGGELETHLEIAKKVWVGLDRVQLSKVEALLAEVMRILNSLINRSPRA